MADVTVVADPIELTISLDGLGLVMYVVASPIGLTTLQTGSLELQIVSTPRNPELDIAYNCSRIGNDGYPVGVIRTTTEILGTWLSICIFADPIKVIISIVSDSELAGKMFNTTALIPLTVTIGGGGTYLVPTMVTTPSKSNWVKWSNIGNLDFTIWKDNIAGERPLDWKGWVYAIKKLGNKVIIYGEGGVSMLAPSNNTFGLLSIHKVGLKGKQAVAGDDKIQFFVDSTGKLYSVGETVMKASLFEASIYPEKLDYSGYLSTMDDLVLSWDGLNRLLYICDGMSGYVYSSDDKSMGTGPINITGIGLLNGSLYAVSSSTITNPIFEICTGIYDMGSRKNKTINSVELGIDVTGDLWVTLDYRKDKAANFVTLPWKKVSPNGITNIPCYGIEFRVRVKRTTYAYFELDYIRVNGIVHDYNFLYPYVGK